MSEQALIFEVGESGFDRYVIENSHKVPVLVEFMGGYKGINLKSQFVISKLLRRKCQAMC